MSHSLTNNDLRQMLRIATGAMLGFIVSKLFEWPNGIFYAVYPMLMLGLTLSLNWHIVRQFIMGTLLPCLFVLIVYGLFSGLPILCTLLVFMAMTFLFYQMSKGALFFFGALSVVGLSIQLHLASYVSNSNDVYTLVISNIRAGFSTLLIACLMHALLPNCDETSRPAPKIKSKASIRHETLLCAIVATVSFLVFQIMNLQSSLSAQAASILILFPLCWQGVKVSSWQRAVGTLVGCNLALLAQLILLRHSGILFFAAFSLWFLVFIMSRAHVLSGGGGGTGFGAITTFGILYGQTLSPQQDIIYNTLYRFSSVAVSVLLTLCLVYVVHRILNCFVSTRHHTFET